MVFERAQELREIGAGITLWANALKALSKLGLCEQVRALTWPPPEGGEETLHEVRSPEGKLLYGIPAGALENALDEESVTITRPDLQKTLLEAFRKAGGEVRLGSNLVASEEAGDAVVSRFADGHEERGDLLVGADGIRSAVRERFLGDGAPSYVGYVAWQGIAELKDDPAPGATGFFTLGRGGRFGLIKLHHGRHYWFATRNKPKSERDAATASKAELLALFGSCHAPIRKVIGATEEGAIHRNGIYHREPLGKRWGAGRVTLLGDAAHPMTPDLGQGACQAIEDAVVLARSVREASEAEASLRLYEASRARRAAYVVRRSRSQSRMLQLGDPLLWRLRNGAFRALPNGLLLSAQLRSLRPISGHEP